MVSMSPVRPLLLWLFLLEAGDWFANWEPVDFVDCVDLEVSDWAGAFFFGMACPVLKVIDVRKKQ